MVIDVQVQGCLFSRAAFPYGLYSLQHPTNPPADFPACPAPDAIIFLGSAGNSGS